MSPTGTSPWRGWINRGIKRLPELPQGMQGVAPAAPPPPPAQAQPTTPSEATPETPNPFADMPAFLYNPWSGGRFENPLSLSASGGLGGSSPWQIVQGLLAQRLAGRGGSQGGQYTDNEGGYTVQTAPPLSGASGGQIQTGPGSPGWPAFEGPSYVNPATGIPYGADSGHPIWDNGRWTRSDLGSPKWSGWSGELDAQGRPVPPNRASPVVYAPGWGPEGRTNQAPPPPPPPASSNPRGAGPRVPPASGMKWSFGYDPDTGVVHWFQTPRGTPEPSQTKPPEGPRPEPQSTMPGIRPSEQTVSVNVPGLGAVGLDPSSEAYSRYQWVRGLGPTHPEFRNWVLGNFGNEGLQRYLDWANQQPGVTPQYLFDPDRR